MNPKQPSEIQLFYKATKVFFTGCTGFLGKILLEKLLRSCNTQTIYCLVRDKKGQLAEERFNKLFDSPMFEKLKEAQPNFRERLKVVRGDCTMDRLGLSTSDRSLLKEVDIVFHVAATIRFNQRLKIATKTNLLATKFLLDLAKEMKSLKSFVYTSTAYSNCDKEEVHEVIYKNRFGVDKFLRLMEDFDDEFIDDITPQLLGSLPNTYVLTKGLTEELLLDYGKLQCKLPIVIVRPSILSSAYKEPLPGWLDTWYNIGSISVAGSYGLLRTANTDPEKLADIVPTDYVANCVIVSATKSLDWNVKQDQLPVLNYVCSVEAPITWGDYTRKCFQHGMEYIPSQCARYPMVKLTKYPLLHRLRKLYMHDLPALLVDAFCYLFGLDLNLGYFYKLLHTFLDETAYFSTRQWRFRNDNVQALWKEMAPEDQIDFPFSLEDFSWDEYIVDYLRMGRVHMLGESPANLPAARRRLRWLRVAHYIWRFAESCALLLFLLWLFF